MTSIQTKFKVEKNAIEAIKKAVLKLVHKKFRDNFGDFRPVVEDAINEEIVRSSSRFIPTQNEAGELGVGEEGTVSVEKTEVAWTALLTDSPERVTTFTLAKAKTIGIFTIGKINVNINEERFFTSSLSVIDTESDELPQIPWMQWFIEGAKISTHKFVKIPRSRSEVSRTGKGLMIKGGLWSFTPRSKANIEKLLNRIRLTINKRLKTSGVTILRK